MGGTFNHGVSKAVVWVHTLGMSAGHYSATVSIFVPGADNNHLCIPVELDIVTAEDPAVIVTREFWQSSYYKRYWDLACAY